MSGTTSGIWLYSPTLGAASVDNYGTVYGGGTAGDGAWFGRTGTLVYDGSIRSLNPGMTGVYFYTGGTLTQTANGTIDASASGARGAIVNGGTFNVSNAGTIHGNAEAILMYNAANTTIDNLAGGTLSSDGRDVVLLASGQETTLNNSGLIKGSGSSAYSGVKSAFGRTVHLNNLAGGVIDAGTGVFLAGDNSTIYNSGTITGNGGTAIRLLANDSSVTLDTGSVTNGDIVSWGSGNTLTLQGTGATNSAISGMDSLTMAGGNSWTVGGSVATKATHVDGGTLAVTGDLVNDGGAGTTTVAPGATLQIGAGSNKGTLRGSVANDGRVVFNRDWAYYFDGAINGSGSVEQNGPGELIFRADHTYTGGTTINGGTLQIGSGNTGSVVGDIENNANRGFGRFDGYTGAEVPMVAALPQQLRQGDLAMLGNLHRRLGDDDAPRSASPSNALGRRVWARGVYTDLDIQQAGDVSPRSEGYLSGMQAGVDLWATPQWRTGLYVGYVQGGDHRYTLRPELNAQAAGKASSVAASLEVGQSFAIGDAWTVQPQAQLIYQKSGIDDLALGGAQVRQDTDAFGSTELEARQPPASTHLKLDAVSMSPLPA